VSGSSSDIEAFMGNLARICEDAAHLFLRGPAPAEQDSTPAPIWELERLAWLDTLGSEKPAGWVNEITSTYLAEAAHQVLAVGHLLRNGTVTAALDPLVRAAIERAGRVKWILDPGIETRERAIRAGIELGVSYQHYREVLARLGADDTTRKSQKKRDSRHRELLESWFQVDRPPRDPCDESSKPTKDMTQWAIEGQSFPTYTEVAQIALGNEQTTHGQAAGSYDGMSGFSHPSVVFSREHRIVDDSGATTFTYQPSDLEKAARFGAFSFLNAVRHWATYYGAEPQALQERVDALGDEMDQISVLSSGAG
jgi:hypothetical protein